MSRWARGRDAQAYAKLLLLLLVCLRGHVFLYQGEELGLPQAEVPYDRLVDPEARANWPSTLGRDGARTPMPWRAGDAHAGFSTVEPWLPVDPLHPPLSVQAQEAYPGSTLHFTRRLLAVRRRLQPLHSAELRLSEGGDDILMFERSVGADALLCVFNLGADEVRTGLPTESWEVIFATPEASSFGPAPSRLAVCGGFIARHA